MTELSSIIKHYRSHFYETFGKSSDGRPAPCNYYKGNEGCSNAEGCFCKKMAEVKGYIDYVIPPQYRKLNLDHARGYIIDKDGVKHEVWPEKEQLNIQKILKSYLFGDVDTSSFTTREQYNNASKMDTRFTECANLIIHGKPKFIKKSGLPLQSVPTGKTLIASLVLKEAIWRKLYKKNRADSYHITSYQTLRQDLKLKSEKASELKEYSWLVIDDITEPLNINDFNHQNFLSLFDDFLMSRMEDNLPTILICEFDASAKDYTNVLGYSFQKIVAAKNTWLISVGE